MNLLHGYIEAYVRDGVVRVEEYQHRLTGGLYGHRGILSSTHRLQVAGLDITA